jgi:hypothetical protein
MFSFPTPEDTHIQHRQQMQGRAFFWRSANICKAYMGSGCLARELQGEFFLSSKAKIREKDALVLQRLPEHVRPGSLIFPVKAT